MNMHTFHIDGLNDPLHVVRFEGHEGMSQLFEFSVLVACEAGDLAFDAVVGRPAALTFHAGAEPRHVHGIVASFEQGDEGQKLTAYRAVLVPAVWRLCHRRDSRIFQGLAVPAILEQVLQAAGVPGTGCRFALSGRYAPREYCVQYRESDWAFLCRLMEEEGIAYHFEHTDAAHVLVMADSPSVYAPIVGDARVAFRPSLGALVKGEHVSRFRYAERVRPGKVTLRDYNFKKPRLLLEGVEQATADPDLEIYDYPGDYDVPGLGSARAKIRLEELQARRKTGGGEGACARFVPGATFTLADHPATTSTARSCSRAWTITAPSPPWARAPRRPMATRSRSCPRRSRSDRLRSPLARASRAFRPPSSRAPRARRSTPTSTAASRSSSIGIARAGGTRPARAGSG